LKYLQDRKFDANPVKLERIIAEERGDVNGILMLMVLDPECMQVLLKAGADPCFKGYGGLTALHYAAGRTWELVKLLLDAKADLNAVDDNGRTPLHYACESDTQQWIYGNDGPVKIMQLLINSGANIHKLTSRGRLPVDTPGIPIEAAVLLVENGSSCKKDNPLIVVAHQVYLNNKIREALLMAMHSRLGCESGLAQLGPQLLRGVLEHVQMLDILKADPSMMTPLHYAVTTNLSAAKALIKEGANTNAVDVKGNTPLHYASANDDGAMARLLLVNGANSCVRNGDGKWPINFAGDDVAAIPWLCASPCKK